MFFSLNFFWSNMNLQNKAGARCKNDQVSEPCSTILRDCTQRMPESLGAKVTNVHILPILEPSYFHFELTNKAEFVMTIRAFLHQLIFVKMIHTRMNIIPSSDSYDLRLIEENCIPIVIFVLSRQKVITKN